MNDKPAATPVPAATILLLRDGTGGLEVFMVKRHHQVDFVSGALVFPGGKVDATDRETGLAEHLDGAAEMDEARRALCVCAIREAFEESGILLAREKASGAFVGAERLAELGPYRGALDRHEIGMAEMLGKEGLRLALDQLALFAHWITPANMPKRFDTLFFAAPSPVGHVGRHDGRESVDSLWIAPQQAIADRKSWNVVFPTKLNLMKLAESPDVAAAIAKAGASTPLTVTPWVEQSADGPILRIREDAGYAQTSVKLKEAL
ncbi:MAG: NUDIX domain-containing protein [Alphaproteobacteria bacterium]|nr:NUDIX domain-containing protein [Alphaproteobacteria bacterium]MBV9694701.1 NUDIX domain-containing protein [Alphaproteobacteria bacterium]